MRLIDADALLNKKFKYMLHGCDDLLVTVKLQDIENAPTIDAVPVVRCKDCKYLYDELDDYCCMSHRGLVRICENSFCSYGERRKE